MNAPCLHLTVILAAVAVLAAPAGAQDLCSELGGVGPGGALIEDLGECSCTPNPPPTTCGTPRPQATCPVLPIGNPGLTECRTYRISFPDRPQIDPILVDVRKTDPTGTPTGSPLGTVVIGSGGGGTIFHGEGSLYAPLLLQDLLDHGFKVVRYRWHECWTTNSVAVSIKTKSVRYAALLTFLKQTFHSEGIFCAWGVSHGANLIAYGLSTWDLDGLLDLAVMESGPNFVRLDLLCGKPSDSFCEKPEGVFAGIPPGSPLRRPPCDPGPDCDPNLVSTSPGTATSCQGFTGTTGSGFPSASLCDCTASELAKMGVLYNGAALDYSTRVHIIMGEGEGNVEYHGQQAWGYYKDIQPTAGLGLQKSIQFVPLVRHGGMTNTCVGHEALLRALLSGTATRRATLTALKWPSLGTETPDTLQFAIQGPPNWAYAVKYDTTRTFCMGPPTYVPSKGWNHLPTPFSLPMGSGTLNTNGNELMLTVPIPAGATVGDVWAFQAVLSDPMSSEEVFTNMVEVKFR